MHALSVRGAASLVLTFAEEDPSGAHWTPQQAGGHLMNEMIGRRLGHLLSIIATLLVWGCGSKHMFIESPTLDDANSGHVTIYRPDTYFQKYRPDEPHIYIGDRKIETLGVGERISVRLPPGEHRISVRDSLLGIPTYTAGTVGLNVESGGEYFVRYVYDLSEFATMPGGVAYPVGQSSISVVSPQVARSEGL